MPHVGAGNVRADFPAACWTRAPFGTGRRRGA